MIFACVDARGIFTYVKAGDPGSMGDAACWNTCSMKEKIDNNEWLVTNDEVRLFSGRTVKPFIVADAAFALSDTAGCRVWFRTGERPLQDLE